MRAFINNGGERHWLKVRFKDEVKSIGALVTVKMKSGKTYINQFYTSEGLGSDQTADVFFGLGDQIDVDFVEIKFQDGKTVKLDSPKVDTTIDLSQQ